jgi:DNA replication and repair protein RecF
VRVDRLTCTQWRNLADQTLAFSPGVNLLVGENGQGKTNVLEAIQFFKFGRSFRTHRDNELVRFGAEFARVEAAGTFDAGDADTFAASIEAGGQKRIKVSGKEVERIADLVGRYPCVLFGPGDLAIVSDEPAQRRRFVDSVGSMTDPAYIRVARDYQRILKQRNAALKARASEYELNIWTEQITAAGAELIERRVALVAALEARVQSHARDVESRHALKMRYESSILREAGQMAAGVEEGREAPALSDVFAVKLGSLEREERRRMTTLAGPHRDDVALELDEKDLRKYGSQGQRRLFAILLKLSEMSHLEAELGESCVLLLDDVFSEFDSDVTARLQRLLDGGRQVFVTSPVRLDWGRPARTFSVAAGVVTMEGESS